MKQSIQTKHITITAPNFQRATFHIQGTSPLVIHRFSKKLRGQFEDNQGTGKPAGSKKKRVPQDSDATFNEARYRSKEGWDGFNASAIRNAMISACRLVGYKMILAKLSIFTEADGRDAEEPQIPLVRIYGKAVKQSDMARVQTGQPYITIRPAYHDWEAKVTVRWDADQFTLTDMTNLLTRVGAQVGIGEGRPDSKDSAGMGWGLFKIKEA